MPWGWTALCLLNLLREYPPHARPAELGGGEGRRSPRGTARRASYLEGRDLGFNLRPHARGCSKALLGRGPCEPAPAGPIASPVNRLGWDGTGRRPRHECELPQVLTRAAP